MRNLIALLFVLCLLPLSLKAAGTPVSMVDYVQTFPNRNSALSLKNNTDKLIDKVKFTLVYYDMKGNQLDYKDFNIDVEIRPGMSKKIEVESYGMDYKYEYYKTCALSDSKRIKVQFNLIGYHSGGKYFTLNSNQKTDTKEDKSEASEPDTASADTLNVYSEYSESDSANENKVELLNIVQSEFFLLIASMLCSALYVIVGFMAYERERNVVAWILLTLFLTPFITILLLLVSGKRREYQGSYEKLDENEAY